MRRVDADQLRPERGAFRLSVTEPMDEIAYLDEFVLEVVDRPPGVASALDERFAPEGPRPTGAVVAWREAVEPVRATDLYTEQCSISVNAKDLATMAATLAFAGKNPVTGKQVMKSENVPEVLAVMSTAGLYDDSGKWLYKTGLPAKSGVGGGLIAVSPGKFGIAVVSPPLDAAGNSVRAQKAIADISNALGGNPYDPN